MKKQWFEKNDQYDQKIALPGQIQSYPRLSLIRLFSSGKTQPGWSAKKFVRNEEEGAFDPKRALKFYEKYNMPFAIVMRSVPLICVDIDGKNDGIKTARALGLPPTLG